MHAYSDSFETKVNARLQAQATDLPVPSAANLDVKLDGARKRLHLLVGEEALGENSALVFGINPEEKALLKTIPVNE